MCLCRRRTGRKRARMRAKRMTGQGLNPATGLPFAKHDPYKDPTRLVNPWEDSRQRGRADSPERSAQTGYSCSSWLSSAGTDSPSLLRQYNFDKRGAQTCAGGVVCQTIAAAVGLECLCSCIQRGTSMQRCECAEYNCTGTLYGCLVSMALQGS
jgi:hypothetical protein